MPEPAVSGLIGTQTGRLANAAKRLRLKTGLLNSNPKYLTIPSLAPATASKGTKKEEQLGLGPCN